MFLIAPAAAFIGDWRQSFREFPPRQKPGSFNLEPVMQAVTEVSPGGRVTRLPDGYRGADLSKQYHPRSG